MLADTLKIYQLGQGWSEHHQGSYQKYKTTKIQKQHYVVVKNESGEWIENWFNSEYT